MNTFRNNFYNSLLLDPEGRLVLCQHGDHRMARMEAPLDEPSPDFVTLVDSWHGKRLNSQKMVH